MDENKLKTFLVENPKFKEILERAVQHEEENSKNEHYLGWEWHDVRAYPAELMKLVREGIISIRFKSRKYTHYLLVDRELVKKVINMR